ncbi:hypothetical protein KSS87_009570 [Heliosperma pusillum]|nr:hypothetical protein KSS87_009570 [Heliosperma pusillum]
MEVLSNLSSYLSNASWLIDESRAAAKWTPTENKVFENALAVYDKDTPDRWQKIAAMLPEKSVNDVIKQYKELEDDVSNIEAGLVPIPAGYDDTTSGFTLEWVNRNGYDGLFLLGLKKYGKGDWRNISRNFVVTRTATQVASHAQKYFIRQISGGKDKRRASIHDITTVNIDNENLSADTNSNCKMLNSPDHSVISSVSMPKTHWNFQWGLPNNGAAIAFESMQGNTIISPYGFKMQGQNLLENYLGIQGMGYTQG